MPHLAAVLTISDLGAQGQREDTAGPAAAEVLASAGFEVLERDFSLIVTTGGTGLTERDRTPEATRVVVEYDVPGIPEAMRAGSVERVPTAMLSRGIAGVRKRTLIVNLPGSEQAVRENLAVILPVLAHACDQIRGESSAVASEHAAIQKSDDNEPR